MLKSETVIIWPKNHIANKNKTDLLSLEWQE